MINHKLIHKNFRLNGESFKDETKFLHYTNQNVNELYSFLSEWFDDSGSIEVSTSGSTGKPKKIQLKKEFMINSAKATGDFFDLNSRTTALMCLPIKYIAGKMMLVRAMILGWHLDVIESDSFPLKGIKKTYEFSAMVPLQLYNSLGEIDRIKKLIIGGGLVSRDLQSKLLDLPTKIYATYGMTETITHIAIKPLNRASLRRGTTWQSLYSYTTLPNIKITIDNRNCLVINAPKISSEEVITNDLVKIISNNQFKWLGRYDHIINSGGIKLIPEQIEEKLSAVIDCRFFVAGLPDKILGEKLILVVEGLAQENLKSQISNLKSINKFEVPKSIYFLDFFIETETKKIQHQKTLDLLS
ncbi:MAG: AMP-binding protein [Flavobacteriaceae bacterium]|nr:AMP-binding protein [Flavobacteriaceae bacterium]